MANTVAYGFQSLIDVFAERVTTVGTAVVWDAIEASVAEHNRQLTALMALFTRPAPRPKIRYKTPSVARLQPSNELGRARPIRVAGFYDVAFPIQMGSAALGENFIAGAKMTVDDANRLTNALTGADARWMRDHILASLYTNNTWTYDDPDDEIGALTIQPLANGDTVKYTVMTGADDGATDTHFLAQAGAIADGATDPFQTIHDELMEHPDNSGEVIAFIPTNLKATVFALSAVMPAQDPNVRAGNASDVLVGELGVAHPGEIFGYHSARVWCVEWRSLPNDYIIATTTTGESPLGMREDEETELQGFRQVGNRDDFPYSEVQYMRRAGFGGWNRVGAVVLRVGNASYTEPTNYTAPIP